MTIDSPGPRWEELKPGESWRLPAPSSYRRISVEDCWSMQGTVDVHGPAHLNLEFSPRVCSLSGGIVRWWAFLQEPAQQLAMRRVCRELARLLESPVVLYTPESLDPVDEAVRGFSIEQIIADFRARHGPPAATLASIYAEHDVYREGQDQGRTWTGNGYFVDTFDDLSAEDVGGHSGAC